MTIISPTTAVAGDPLWSPAVGFILRILSDYVTGLGEK